MDRVFTDGIRGLRRQVTASGGQEATDYRLLMSIVFLVMFGLIMIYSATGSMNSLFKQALLAVAGFILMMVVSRVDYHLLMHLSGVFYVLSIGALFLVLTPLKVDSHGATRWIQLPGFQLQPAEFLKPAIVLLTAYFMEKYTERLVYIRADIASALPALIASGLILILTSNLSTAIIVFGIFALMFYVAYPTKKVYALLAVCLAILLLILFFIYTKMIVPAYLEALQNGTATFKEYHIGRIVAWLHPEEFPDLSMQTRYSRYAIGSGGLLGRGIGRGMMKYYIPERGNDFIFAVIGEELGILGCVIVVILFSYQVRRIMVIARHARDNAGSLIAFGIGMHVVLQVVFHIGVTTGAFPNTGVSLPYISYGGTALLIQLAEMGIVLNVDRQAPGKMTVIDGGLEMAPVQQTSSGRR